MQSLSTPIAFIIYNRPDLTARTFEAIRNIQPKQLFLIADGPNSNRDDDARLCQQTRIAVKTGIDWDCDVRENYAEHNLGCRQRVSSGLTWVFQHVERAIILEDDCLPDPTFFPYCEQLLDLYAKNNRVMTIGGTNLLGTRIKTQYSYYYSGHFSGWGWATWHRAWQHYDDTMKEWPQIRDSDQFKKFTYSCTAHKTYRLFFDLTYQRRIDTWDYVFNVSLIKSQGLHIVPRMNLISNIGFGPNATHTRNTKSNRNNLPRIPLSFPLRHPAQITTEPNISKRLETARLRDSLKIQRKPLSKKLRNFRRNLSAKLLGKRRKPRRTSYKHAVFVAGLGRCGTTLLYNAIVAARIADKGFSPRFSDVRLLNPGVYKTHDRPPSFLPEHVKVIFLFRNPFEIAISANKMINQWAYLHHYNLCSERFQPNHSIFYEDTLELKKSFDLWYQTQSFTFISIRYESLWEKGTLDTLNRYLNVEVKLPRRTPSPSRVDRHPQEACIRATYASLHEKIQAARDVKIWEKNLCLK